MGKQLRAARGRYCAAIDDDLYMKPLALALSRMFGVPSLEHSRIQDLPP